jgi:ABC-2 type transport system ATP-binding protein
MTAALAPQADVAPPADGPAIATSGLTKRFGHQVAVDRIDLDVPAGSVFGFLGPNGSGKTTTIRMLLTLVQPTAGSHRLLGMSMPEQAGRALPLVGSLVEGPAFHPYLSGRANLARLDAADRYADPATARRRIDAALDRVGLLPAAGKHYRAYSLGMRQRLAIAAPLLMPRRLLILDEPTNGLDPQGTREVRSLIGSLNSDGTTVLVSSHLLSEVEQVCSHVGVMNSGSLVAQGTVAQVRLGGAQRARVQTPQVAEAARVLSELGLTEVGVDGGTGAGSDTGTASGVLGGVPATSIVPALVRAGVPVLGFAIQRPSLEELFVSLTGEGFDVNG